LSSLSIPTASDSKKSTTGGVGKGEYKSRLTFEKSPMDFTLSGTYGIKNLVSRNNHKGKS